MERIRVFLKLIGFFLCCFLTVGAVACGRVVLRGRNRVFVSWKNRVLNWWASVCIRLLGLRMAVEGRPPQSPFILVTNHLSYLDVVPLWFMTDATFIAKSELQTWPFFGWATRQLGVIFVDRQESRDLIRVNGEIERHLQMGEGVIFFPEGTSSRGEDVLPFHPPLFHYASQNARPVHYATLHYRTADPTRPASRWVCWWGDMGFFDHFLDLLKLKEIEVTIRFGGEPVSSSNRKELAADLGKRVGKLFKPVR